MSGPTNHFPPHDNANAAILPPGNATVPLASFNIVKLTRGETFTSDVPGHETCIVPATGTVRARVGAIDATLGRRGTDVWDGEPEGLYVPLGASATLTAETDAEVFVAGAECAEMLEPFTVMGEDIDVVQYGSDETKTHRRIKHILGQRQAGRVSRLLVSELYTVGQGGWSGFPPHRHQEDRSEGGRPIETRHDEIYNFRFRPREGFGLHLLQPEGEAVGEAFHMVDGSTFAFSSGYHPVVVAPGYEMYYFTILAGATQRPLVQFFQPAHEWQVETIPGIKDMVAKFK